MERIQITLTETKNGWKFTRRQWDTKINNGRRTVERGNNLYGTLI